MTWAAWATGALVVLGFARYGFASLGKIAVFRPFNACACAFAASYCLLLLFGFNWFGEWCRFMVFDLGLRDERAVSLPAPAEWIVYPWRSWGIAGMENDSYLVFDPNRRLAGLGQDGNLPPLKCPIAHVRWLAPSWRVITTSNCTLQ